MPDIAEGGGMEEHPLSLAQLGGGSLEVGKKEEPSWSENMTGPPSLSLLPVFEN